MKEGGLPSKKGRRKKQRTRKRVGKEGWTFCLVQPRKCVEGKTFGAAKSDKRRGLLGGIRVWLGKKKSHSLSNFLAFTLKLSYKIISCIHTHTFLQK